MKKYNVWLYVTVAESTGNTAYYHLGGDAEGVKIARRMCPAVVESERGLKAWLDSHGDQPPSWFYKDVGRATTLPEIKKLMREVK